MIKSFCGILLKIKNILGKRQKISFVFILMIMVISAVLTQLTPLAIGKLTDDVLSSTELSFFSIIPFLLFILAVTVTNEVIKIIRRLLVEDTCTRTEKLARHNAIKSLLKAPLSYFRQHMTGNIHGKLNRSLEGTIRLLKLMFMDFTPAIFTAIAAIIVIFTRLPFQLSIVMIMVVPIGVSIVLRQISTQKGIRVELLETKSSMDGTAVELINGIEVIRVSDSVDFETQRFDTKSEHLRTKEMKHHMAMAKYDCFKFINEAAFTVIVLGYSVYLASQNIISVGAVLTAYLCFLQLTNPLKELHRIFDQLSESTVLADQYFKISEIERDFSYTEIPKQDIGPSSSVTIKNLKFSYADNHDKVILKNFNLEIPESEFIGIVGQSGCGKSSLIKAITKLEYAEGQVMLGRNKIQNLTRHDICEIISLVPQTPFLIAGTIYDNVCYGLKREVSMQEVETACERAFILDYINSLPDKFGSIVAEGGGNLSGGQKQRIAISRIFLRNPKILILDEATSALDNTSEKHVQTEIERMKKENNTTIISIAHRLTTLKNCDRIIVLNKGQIEQAGTFDELLNQSGTFSDMYHGRTNQY